MRHRQGGFRTMPTQRDDIRGQGGSGGIPGGHAGRRLEEEVAAFGGVRPMAERGGFTHVFVVRPSAAEKKLKPVAAPA
ncbi:MAG: hypothetical protein RXR02_00675 [Thermoproteus sp.]